MLSSSLNPCRLAFALSLVWAAAPTLAADCVSGTHINASTTCTVPADVTSIKLQIWGGGGGGAVGNSRGGAGGGGGSLCEGSVSVTPGDTLTVTVGAGGTSGGTDGENSSVTGGGISGFVAMGGNSPSAAGSPRLGGKTDLCVATGATGKSGGNGGALSNMNLIGGGGGGSGWLLYGPGSNGIDGSPSGGGSPGFGGGGEGRGGTGGYGPTEAGARGGVPGGGGGGGGGSMSGGMGAAGRVIISFALTPVNGACGTAAGQMAIVAPTSSLCSAGTPGVLSSTGGKYAWQCQGQSGGTTASCQAPWASAGGGKGSVSLNPGNNWQVNNASFSSTPPAAAPQGVTFPAGLLSLNLSSGTQGSDATVNLNFTTPVPAGAVYMKYGPSPDGFNCQGAACAQPHWYELPASRAVLAPDRLSATLTLTDGGLGDNDGDPNRFIQDPGGFALLATPASTAAIPSLSEWGIIALSSLLAMFGIARMRRRHG